MFDLSLPGWVIVAGIPCVSLATYYAITLCARWYRSSVERKAWKHHQESEDSDSIVNELRLISHYGLPPGYNDEEYRQSIVRERKYS